MSGEITEINITFNPAAVAKLTSEAIRKNAETFTDSVPMSQVYQTDSTGRVG